MMESRTVDQLAAAQQAADRHAWPEAYGLLAALDAKGQLGAAGLELLGTMGWWAAEPDASVSARERAFAAYLAEGDRVRAAYMALLAAKDHQSHLSDVVAQAWRARAARILNEEPESFAHGYLVLFESEEAMGGGDFVRAAELAGRAVDIGSRFGDKDLQGFGLVFRGMALVRGGELKEGLLLLDEATAAAVSGELSPFATGVVYCATISTCRDLADYRRAGQWTEVARRWCERQAISGFPGVCRVHRAEILSLHGEWTSAEDEARRASEELLSYKAFYQAAEGFYALSEIRLRMGDLAAADEALRQAQDLGREPQPARALLYLAQGRVDAAMSSIGRALAEPIPERLRRARLLPAQVEIALAAGDIATARTAAEELAGIAEDFGSPALHAAAHCARGAIHNAAGEPEQALQELGRGLAHWQTVDAPYEIARTRRLIGDALRLREEVDDARLEWEAARSTFERLGAVLDVARCEKAIEALQARNAGHRERRTFMFTDIVGSTELISAIGDEAWGDLKRWHDQTLRALVSQNAGEEVNEAGDGFFFAFRTVPEAVDSAMAIQRALAEHRRQSGFAPRVRIGLHVADATKVEDGYLGQGVHQAARIGALAGAGEIVASAETLAGESIEGAGPARSVALKGISGMVEVQAISWA